MTAHMVLHGLAIFVIAALLGALSTVYQDAQDPEPVDAGAFRAGLAQLGFPNANVEELIQLMEGYCGGDTLRFATEPAIAAEREGRRGVARYRLAVEHVCPERLDEFDDATRGLPTKARVPDDDESESA